MVSDPCVGCAMGEEVAPVVVAGPFVRLPGAPPGALIVAPFALPFRGAVPGAAKPDDEVAAPATDAVGASAGRSVRVV